MEFSEQKFSISAVWSYDPIRVEKYNPFMTAQVCLCQTLSERPSYFLYQELHYKKLLHYFENVVQIYVKGPIFLMKKNANLTFMFFENLIWTMNTCTTSIKSIKEKLHGILIIHETINLPFTWSK